MNKKEFWKLRIKNIALSISAILLIWIVWIIVYYSAKNNYIIPSFQDTFIQIGNEMSNSKFWIFLLLSLTRTIIGFIIALILAILICLLSKKFISFKSFLAPIMYILKSLPVAAAILLILVWSNPFIAPIIVVFLMFFPIAYTQLNASIDSIDTNLIKMLKFYNVKKNDFFKICFKQSMLYVLKNIGNDFSLCFKIMFSAEILANTKNSLGGLIHKSQDFVNLPQLAAITILTIIVGIILDISLSQFIRLTYKWNPIQ